MIKQASKHKSRETIQNTAMYDYVLQELGQVTAHSKNSPLMKPHSCGVVTWNFGCTIQEK